jgi:D-alanyl-D-alanine carboxypeptidase/D-alanyl-D-alanine-endopeptidase (penicillin-binding protein 4)
VGSLRLQLAAAAVCAAVVFALPARADLAERARTLVGAGQGVYVEDADGKVLVAQAADLAVHPASVSKVPTSLVLLRKLGPEHRFVTRFVSRGAIEGGTLRGTLGVEADGDPFFVDENALVVALELRKLGVHTVTGPLTLNGRLLFNWQEERATLRLRQALAGRVPPAAWQAVRAARRETGAPPALTFLISKRALEEGPDRTLLTHRSEPLVPLLKALNGYSNNVFGWLAGAAGGIAVVEAEARASVPEAWRDEITLGDGAGTNPRNRLSPRAAVALLRALEREAAASGATLADLLPVAGVDPGTLKARLAGPGERGRVAAKTGTYGDYGACALAGALRTKSRGVVYFAILNHRVPIEDARRRQDAFVRALLGAFDTEPWPYVRDEAPAFTRASVTPGAP